MYGLFYQVSHHLVSSIANLDRRKICHLLPRHLWCQRLRRGRGRQWWRRQLTCKWIARTKSRISVHGNSNGGKFFSATAFFCHSKGDSAALWQEFRLGDSKFFRRATTVLCVEANWNENGSFMFLGLCALLCKESFSKRWNKIQIYILLRMATAWNRWKH